MHDRGRAASSDRADKQLRQVRLRELARSDPEHDGRDGQQHAARAACGHRLGRTRRAATAASAASGSGLRPLPTVRAWIGPSRTANGRICTPKSYLPGAAT